jgi:hypothetical protein
MDTLGVNEFELGKPALTGVSHLWRLRELAHNIMIIDSPHYVVTYK